MKYIYTFLLAFFITVGATAQNCIWSATNSSGNVVVLTPPLGFPALQYYAEWDIAGTIIHAPMSPLTYQFPGPGYFTICLSIIDSSTSQLVCNYCDSIYVGGNCTFSYIQDSINPGQFTFFASLQSPGSTASWSFGDGTGGTGTNVTHTYNAPGNYIVTMNELDSMGNPICSTTILVNYSNTINCSFSVTPPTPAGLPNAYQFNAVAAPGSSITWDFGDGSTGSGANATHVFALSGNYMVCMTAISFIDTCVTCQVINVNNNPGGNCSAFAIQDSINPGMFTFFGTGSVSGSNLSWNFGDGTTGTGAVVVHQYGAPGFYIVIMTETDPQTGNVLCVYTLTVNINSSTGCTFTLSNSPANPYIISVAGPSLANASYYWDFGDGTTATGLNATHTYAAAGTYNVCLSIGQNGVIVCTSCQVVTITGNTSCQANFTSVSIGLIAYFIDQSVVVSPTVPPLPPPVNYTWDFGDGNTSTLQFPQHQYSAPGTYLVCLNVSTVGCTSTYCDSIVIDTTSINPVGCNAFFIFTQLNPYQLIGVNLSSGVNLNFSWDFGDGSPLANGAYPTHQYSSTGTFVVCLTVSDFLGCSDTYCDTLTVDSLGNIVYKGLTVGFTLNIYSPSQLTSGLDEQPVNTISKLYPVPVTDQLVVEWTSEVTGALPYTILAVDGRLVGQGSISHAANRVNTESLAPGIYLFRIANADGSTASKLFVKQ